MQTLPIRRHRSSSGFLPICVLFSDSKPFHAAFLPHPRFAGRGAREPIPRMCIQINYSISYLRQKVQYFFGIIFRIAKNLQYQINNRPRGTRGDRLLSFSLLRNDFRLQKERYRPIRNHIFIISRSGGISHSCCRSRFLL